MSKSGSLSYHRLSSATKKIITWSQKDNVSLEDTYIMGSSLIGCRVVTAVSTDFEEDWLRTLNSHEEYIFL